MKTVNIVVPDVPVL